MYVEGFSMSGMNVSEVYASHLMRFPGETLYLVFWISVVFFSTHERIHKPERARGEAQWRGAGERAGTSLARDDVRGAYRVTVCFEVLPFGEASDAVGGNPVPVFESCLSQTN